MSERVPYFLLKPRDAKRVLHQSVEQKCTDETEVGQSLHIPGEYDEVRTNRAGVHLAVAAVVVGRVEELELVADLKHCCPVSKTALVLPADEDVELLEEEQFREAESRNLQEHGARVGDSQQVLQVPDIWKEHTAADILRVRQLVASRLLDPDEVG